LKQQVTGYNINFVEVGFHRLICLILKEIESADRLNIEIVVEMETQR